MNVKIQEMRKLLFRVVNRDFFIFLFFLLLSGAFWLSMTLDETTEREYSIAVELADIPENAVITTEHPLHSTLRNMPLTSISQGLSQAVISRKPSCEACMRRQR